MECKSLLFNPFTNRIETVSEDSLRAIISTVQPGEFPKAQICLYLKLSRKNPKTSESLALIKDSAHIFRMHTPWKNETKAILARHFKEDHHCENLYSILKSSWKDDSHDMSHNSFSA